MVDEANLISHARKQKTDQPTVRKLETWNQLMKQIKQVTIALINVT